MISQEALPAYARTMPSVATGNPLPWQRLVEGRRAGSGLPAATGIWGRGDEFWSSSNSQTSLAAMFSRIGDRKSLPHHGRSMTNDTFRELCDEMLVPRFKDVQKELRDHKDLLGTILQECQRLRDEVEALEFALANRDDASE